MDTDGNILLLGGLPNRFASRLRDAHRLHPAQLQRIQPQAAQVQDSANAPARLRGRLKG
jgi:hypothetical protein